ncbi:HAMP domain-containing sensor histidine kinase [Nocardia iowensis]
MTRWSPGVVLSSLRGRILVAMVSVACATAVLTGGALAVKTRNWVYEGAQEAVFSEFRHDMQNYFGKGQFVTVDELSSEYTVTVDGVVVRQGETRIGEFSSGLREGLDRSSDIYLFERLPGQRVGVGYAVAERDRPEAGHLSVYTIRKLDGVPEKLNQLAWIISVSVLGCAVLGALLGFGLTTSIVRPLRRIENAARRVADGEAISALPDTTLTELRDVTTTFNDMVDRQREIVRGLVEQDERAQRFVSDVAHELRSPLAALVPAAEVLDEELTDRDGDIGTAARLIGSEINGLARLVEDLLEMSQRDQGHAVVLSETVDLVELTARTLRLRGWADTVAVTHEFGEERTIRSDPRRIEAIIANLVGNAFRHGRPPIAVVTRRGPDRVRIEVRDSGPGIPAGHVERVFERLHKVSESRTRTGGAGLGLAIARENARLLGGDLTYRRTGDTTVFSAELPTGDL